VPSALFVLVGIPILLVGLVGMGPQVNVHRIRPWSAAAWVFRIGGAFISIGLLLSLSSGLDSALIIVSLILGTACVIASSVIVHHEWIQAGHAGQPDFKLQFAPLSLILWIGTMMLGTIVIVGLAAQMVVPTLSWLIIFEMLMGFGLMLNIQTSAERQRANFVLTQSFSLQAYIIGVIGMVLGLILLVKGG
jgi:hypothetical protein